MLNFGNHSTRHRKFGAAVFATFLYLITPHELEATKTPSDKNIVTAAVPAEFPPHYSLDKSGNPQGFAIDVMDKIAETAGLKVRYIVKKNWGVVFEDLRSGRVDLIPNLGITEKRKLDFDFTLPVETFPISIFVREGTYDIKGQNDLSGHNIAAVKNNAAVILLEGREDINLRVFNDPREALFDLLAGHTDALVYPETVTRKLAQTIRVEDRIKIAGKPLIELKRAIAVQKGNTLLLARLNKAVETFVATEEYNRIFVKFHGKPTEFWTVSRVTWVMGWVIAISIAVMLIWRYRTVARLNINLMKTVEERKRADKEIEHQKTMFESIFNGVADAIVLTDPQRKIVTCNPAFTKILGYSLQDIIGKETGVFYESWEVFKRMGKERFNLSAKEKLKPYVVTYRRKDGTLFPGETIGTVIHGKEGTIVGFLGVIRDITERNLAEEELERKSGFIKLLQEITAKANESKSTEEILQFCLDKVRALTKWPVGHVYMASEENPDLMLPSSIWSLKDEARFNEFRNKTNNFNFPIGGGLPGRVLASAKPAWITDVRTDPNFARAGLAREVGLISAFAFPILSGSSLSAVLEFYSAKAMEPDEQLLEIMAQIGTQTGRVIERQRAEEALHSSEVSLASAQKIAHVGSWEWDMVLNKVTWSDEAYRLYGYEPGAVEPTLDVFLDAVHPDDRDKVLKDVNEAVSENKQYAVDHRVIGPDGIERIVHAIGKVVSYDKEGKPLCMVGTVSDITKRKKDEMELEKYGNHLEHLVEERTSELAAVNKELEAFSYSVSHDLRAPLRSIDGFSQILLDDYEKKLDEGGKHLLQRLRTNSQNMAQLIDDLLDLSRLTRKEMHRQEVDLSALARDITKELREAESGRRVKFAIFDDAIVNGDPNLLKVMMKNLLGNAWKFTGKQKDAQIEFGVTQQNGDTSYFVRDNGAGFDMAYADKLFGAFQRLHSDSEFSGTGIGLATVQRIVHRHGGKVWAEGEVEKGATFHFTLVNRGEQKNV